MLATRPKPIVVELAARSVDEVWSRLPCSELVDEREREFVRRPIRVGPPPAACLALVALLVTAAAFAW